MIGDTRRRSTFIRRHFIAACRHRLSRRLTFFTDATIIDALHDYE